MAVLASINSCTRTCVLAVGFATDGRVLCDQSATAEPTSLLQPSLLGG